MSLGWVAVFFPCVSLFTDDAKRMECASILHDIED